MPCYDPRDNSSRYADALDKELQEVREELDERTAMLCEAMALLEDSRKFIRCNTGPAMSTKLFEWWKAHREWDQKRLEKGDTKYVKG